MSLKLCLFLIEATASERLAKAKPELKAGSRYVINCFAVEQSIEKARGILPRFFRKTGWDELTVKGEKIVPPTLRAIPDPELRKLAKTASEKGVAFMVYANEEIGRAHV